MPKFDPIPKTDPAEIERLIERLRQSNLEQRDLELVERLLQTVLSLVRLLQQKNASLKRLKRLIFGPGSDRRIGTGSDSASSPEDKKRDSQTDSNPQPGPDASSQTLQLSSNQKSKRRGHGRMASSVYTGAKIVICPHPTLKASDSCPAPYCQGRLYDTKEPAIFIQLTGQALVGATKYEQEVLRCTSCQERFTASLPADVAREKYDATCDVSLAIAKYGAGLPWHRLEQMQETFGVPLPATVQFVSFRRAGAHCCSAPKAHDALGV